MRRYPRGLIVAGVAMLVAVGVAAQGPATAQGNGQKIGVVDVQRVLARSAAGVAAREQLERDKATMQKEVDGKRQELEKLKEELDKKGALMTADARKEKQDVFDRKRRDATRLVDDLQKELAKREEGLLQKVLQEISGVIERVGKQKNYFMIVEKRGGSVVFANAEADITEEIIRAYDQDAAARKK
jgi:outer membrane protein